MYESEPFVRWYKTKALLRYPGGAADSAAHPLKAASWTPLAVDLGHRGWTAGLRARGFRTDVATVWLAEGLLMYLPPPAVDAMLQEMAGAQVLGATVINSGPLCCRRSPVRHFLS